LITSGKTLETAGIRMQKYIPDASNVAQPNNDYVFMRYSDALMMKAEAIARGQVLMMLLNLRLLFQDQVRWERFLLH
jgi:hypothetical protein